MRSSRAENCPWLRALGEASSTPLSAPPVNRRVCPGGLRTSLSSPVAKEILEELVCHLIFCVFCLLKMKPFTHIVLYCVLCTCVCAKTLQSCLTLCDPMGCSPSGSSVHGIFQATVPEWVAISSSRGTARSKDQTHISCFGRPILYG